MNPELLWQFDLTWALADLHLTALVEDDFLWEPAALCWTVRPDTAGVWRADWAGHLVVVDHHRQGHRSRDLSWLHTLVSI